MHLLQEKETDSEQGVMAIEVDVCAPGKDERSLRNFVRFNSLGCVIVDVKSDCTLMGEMLDLSLGGLRFRLADTVKNLPTRGKLEGLQLNDVADDLEGRGLLR